MLNVYVGNPTHVTVLRIDLAQSQTFFFSVRPFSIFVRLILQITFFSFPSAHLDLILISAHPHHSS